MRLVLSALLLALAPAAAIAQGSPPAQNSAGANQPRVAPSAAAARTATPPQIDGRLDDAAWAQAEVISNFTQRDPADGQPASEATEVRIVYDDQAIYVGARLRDRSGVTSRLGRRDMPLAASDWFRVSFDSYRDRRTAFRFDVNPSGVRRDATLGASGGLFGQASFAGAEGDLAWDAVWDAEVTTDAEGWTAEMRIPFSQLRFARADEQLWGLQLERIIDRTQELSLFSYTSKSETGGVPAFGDLTGLRGIRPGRPLELIPYVLSEATLSETGQNPFAADREVEANAGLDARYRITSNLTLSATINPDFGQVEVDPAIINLSAFETRLEEKRPFFVEGASSFRFGGNIQGPGANAANLLYSRRLGRAPQVGIRADAVDAMGITDIVGAAKLSGKTSNGWSIGILEAVTSEERRRYLDPQGDERRAVVEPLTNYFTARLNRELRQGRSSVGGIVTAVNRDVSDAAAAAVLRSSAYMGGLDFSHEWANRAWALGGFLVGGQVDGSAAAITAAQRASSRYYQRPDSRALQVDSAATSLGGYAATVQLRKAAGLHFTGDLWAGVVSPGLEINDLGFQQRADRVATGGMIRYAERRPGRVLRNWSANVSQNHALNFDGDLIERVVRGGATLTHLNYWDISLQTSYQASRLDDRLTRGGPLARVPSAWTVSSGIGSDPRKSIIGSVDVSVGGDEAGGGSRSVQAIFDFRTSPRWNLSLGPRISHVEEDAQYLTSVRDASMTETYGTRYLFAPLEQTQLSLVTRLNYTFTPDLTLEVYAQPLVSNGDYGAPKYLTRPGAYEFAPFTGNTADRSFTTRSLRGNAVLRWEYRPGSTLYVVWQQARLNDEFIDDFRATDAFGTLLDAPATNVFVLKWTYWINP